MADPLETTLRRLQEERERADRLYNDALTALDHALAAPPPLPHPPGAYDEHQITPLNESWNIVAAPPAAAGWRGRLTGFIWRTVGPFFERQLTFNSRVVDHLNRNVAGHRERIEVASGILSALRTYMDTQAALQSRLMYLLQQITPYVDTKDRDTGGRTLVLNAALGAVADGTAKRAESTTVRVERLERETAARMDALEREQRQAHQDLRASAAASHRAIVALTREADRTAREPSATPAPPAPGGVVDVQTPGGAAAAFGGRLDAYKYVAFEDQFRGSEALITERLRSYLPFFAGRSNVLDVGCGRGEFLELLGAEGIAARGIDVNPEMVEVCRARGLDAVQAGAVEYLEAIDEASLGGVFAAQVVEHLEPGYLLRFLDLAFGRLRPGGRLVLETLNPACWVAFFESYIRDITHVRPLHPETLKYLVIASGFPEARIEYRSPVPAEDRLQHASETALPELEDLIRVCNTNVDTLNARLFTHLDYAVVAEKPAESGVRSG